MRFMLLFRSHARLRSQVDAYIDGELSPGASVRFETHLRGCKSCTGAVALGREIKTAFASVAPVEAPRSFRLTPVMIQQPARPAAAAPRGQFALRLAQATAGVAIVGLAAVSVYDFSSSDSSGSTNTMASAGMSESAKSAGSAQPASGLAAPAATSSAPVRDAAATAPPALPTPIMGGAGAQSNPGATATVPAFGLGGGPAPAVPHPGDASSAVSTQSQPHAPAGGPGVDDDSPGAARWLEYGLGALAVVALASWGAMVWRSRR